MKTIQMLIAGFGGQGVLFLGKIVAYQGLIADKQVSWLPSYGPEMRGGTANCSIIISDTPVGSPIVAKPDCLVAMNLPSLDKYEDAVLPGGKIFVDSTLITRKIEREDVQAFYIPATQIANDMGIPTLANMIILGKVLSEYPEIGMEHLEAAMGKVVSAKRANLIEQNLNAIKLGYEYKGE
ncbi:MAG: 2-oxoacid:acceptor oxidoreductase family protein [Clostridia bacterium]|nr:2-oxoacid:acceptor oxidoreductase family protein [Clostridia bacterium]MBQ5793728.1 2-oxoacid:acceptor oxidoreductase family protein [Clostridia bacterium]